MAEINSWLAARNLPDLSIESLPQTGYIVPDVAVGFLYQTDSDVCLLDSYIANPRAPLRRRSRAFDLIVRSLLRTAQQNGARKVIAACASGGVARRAERLGMRHTGIFAGVEQEITRGAT